MPLTSPLPVADMPMDATNAEGAIVVRAAIAAIQTLFGHDAESRAIVARLRLLARILEQPPRTCKRCAAPFRLANGAVLSFFRRGAALPWHCAACRTQRRHERAEREQR
jgi:hypothetical protein